MEQRPLILLVLVCILTGSISAYSAEQNPQLAAKKDLEVKLRFNLDEEYDDWITGGSTDTFSQYYASEVRRSRKRAFRVAGWIGGTFVVSGAISIVLASRISCAEERKMAEQDYDVLAECIDDGISSLFTAIGVGFIATGTIVAVAAIVVGANKNHDLKIINRYIAESSTTSGTERPRAFFALNASGFTLSF
jgi:hypothetical protein